MKKVIIKNYIQGLASFLDDENIKWEHTGIPEYQQITIYYHDEEDLFKMGVKFGEFVNNYLTD